MATEKSDKKKTTILIIGFLVLLSPLLFACGIAIFTWSVLVIDGVIETVTWREHTIPLAQEVVDDLCTKFELDADDERCDHSGDDVYGPDFYDLLYQTFTPKDSPWATQEEIDQLIGDYKYECKPPSLSADGREYTSCHYDFAGDKVYRFAIWYYADGQVKRIIANVVD
jgi:hypothetical protein